jgi:hypothetical protein
MAQYGGKAVIPIEVVCPDYFSHLNPTKLVQKISTGEMICAAAAKLCVRGSRGSYDLVAANF